jgi:hypothetical protein
MIEKFEKNRTTGSSSESTNIALNFITKRLSASERNPEARRLAGEALGGDWREGFFKLVDSLQDGRKRYTLESLKDRDSAALRQEGTYLPAERSNRMAILRREDTGVPTALEIFFLSIFSEKERQELCAMPEAEDPKLGELTVRNVIDSVLADEPRTKKFVHAVQHEVQSRDDKELAVYDVGCGAFPILGLTAALSSPNAKVTCLELHPLSAAIARATVQKFEERGVISKGQITIKEGDALLETLPEEGSIDIFISETLGAGLLDEVGPQIFRRYAPSVKAGGASIPARVKLYAAFVPTNLGVSFDKDTGKHDAKYPFVLNTNGDEVPVLPREEWRDLYGGKEISLGELPKKVEASIAIPQGLKSEDLHNRYSLEVSAEYIIDTAGIEVATRYETFITTPTGLGDGLVSIPEDLLRKSSRALAVKFAFSPGQPSNQAKVEVVERGA